MAPIRRKGKLQALSSNTHPVWEIYKEVSTYLSMLKPREADRLIMPNCIVEVFQLRGSSNILTEHSMPFAFILSIFLSRSSSDKPRSCLRSFGYILDGLP
jgi:hypothetical protein